MKKNLREDLVFLLKIIESGRELFSLFFYGFLFTVYPVIIIFLILLALGVSHIQVDGIENFDGWISYFKILALVPVVAFLFSLISMALITPGLKLLDIFLKLSKS